MRCSFCKEDVFVKIRYMKKRYCKVHFAEFVESKVKNTIKKYKLINGKEKILVAVSGGKDSSALLYIMKKIFPKNITPIHFNLGIDGFSKTSEDAVKKLCKSLKLKPIVINLKNLIGFTISDIKSKRICGVCGLIKRYLLNKIAFEMGFDKIAVGHNLDDELSFVLNCLISGDLLQLSRIGPKTETKGKLIGRIKPLYRCYEKEMRAYCEAVRINYVKASCPYSKSAKQEVYKKALNLIEENSPGTKLSFINSFLKKIKPLLPKEEVKLKKCKECDFPTTSDICAFCKIKKVEK